jgi:hypothetical protein
MIKNLIVVIMGSIKSKDQIDFRIPIPKEFQDSWNSYGKYFYESNNYKCPELVDDYLVGLGPLKAGVFIDQSLCDEIKQLGLILLSESSQKDRNENLWGWKDKKFDNPTNFYEFLCNYTYQTRNWIIFNVLKTQFEILLKDKSGIKHNYNDPTYKLNFNKINDKLAKNCIKWISDVMVISNIHIKRRLETLYKYLGISPVNLNEFNTKYLEFTYIEPAKEIIDKEYSIMDIPPLFLRMSAVKQSKKSKNI